MVKVVEKIEYVKYKGLPFNKKHFRVTVYGANKAKKIANSWDEYQDLVATGLWFDDKKKALEITAQKDDIKDDVKKPAKKG